MEEDDCNLMESHRIFRSLDDFASSATSSSRGLYTTEDHIRPALVPSRPRQRKSHNSHMPLAKAKSTPLHLNQIFEERESDLEDSPRNSPQIERARKHIGGGAIKAKRNNRRLSPVPSTGSSRRSSSCSSSDDDDLDKHMKRLNTSSSCRRSPGQHYRKDDSGSEGDGGGGANVQRSVRSLESSSSTQPPSKEPDSGSKQDSQKQNSGGKTRNNIIESKFTLDSIDESNKENFFSDYKIKDDMLGHSLDLTQRNKEHVVKCRVNSAPLPAKNEVEHISRTYSMLCERKGSAVKYIHSFAELEKTLENKNETLSLVGSGKRDSLTPADIDSIDMEVKRPRTINSDHLPQVLRSPTVRSVTSACCQIF